MRKQRGNLEIASSLIVLLIAGVITYFFLAYRCGERWLDSGMNSKFGFSTGCMIQVKDGKWIPEDRYREIDE